jgi:hypothetical protein
MIGRGALLKAFAQARLVRTEDAIATLTALRRTRRPCVAGEVLEADVRKMAGQNRSTAARRQRRQILAINGIASTDQRDPPPPSVLTASNTLTAEARDLRARPDKTRAHQILLRYAKGAGNPELQAEAVRYLASRRDSPTRSSELKEIYESTQDVNIRRAVIDAYRSSGDKAALVGIIRGRGEPVELRRSAISGLQNLAAPSELWALYQQETDTELRNQMVGVFASMGAIEQLTQIVKTEGTECPAERRARGQQNNGRRASCVGSLRRQSESVRATPKGSWPWHKENDLELQRDIIKRLSDMAPKNKAAAASDEMINK